MCIFKEKVETFWQCVRWRMCVMLVGLSHILETGMVYEHKALLDAPRRGWGGGKREAAH